MSVFKLEAGVHLPIDSRYIGAIEVEILNVGAKDFNIWAQLMSPDGTVFYETLVRVPGGQSKRLQEMSTFERPFVLLMVANTNRFDQVDITLRALRYGNLVAFFKHDHFDRVH